MKGIQLLKIKTSPSVVSSYILHKFNIFLSFKDMCPIALTAPEAFIIWKISSNIWMVSFFRLRHAYLERHLDFLSEWHLDLVPAISYLDLLALNLETSEKCLKVYITSVTDFSLLMKKQCHLYKRCVGTFDWIFSFFEQK